MQVSGIKVSPRVDAVKFAVQGEDLDGLAEVLDILGENEVNIWFIVQVRNRDDVVNITLCVDPEAVERTVDTVQGRYPGSAPFSVSPATILSVFPYRDNPEIAVHLLQTLEEVSVPVLGLSTSLSSLACLIPYEQEARAKQSLEKTFGLAP